MTKQIFILLLFPLLLSSCKSFSQSTDKKSDKEIIKGDWINIDDNAYTLKISANQVVEYNNNQLTETFKYELLNYSCDTAYMKPSKEKVLFLKKVKESETYCYEVSLDSNNLSLTYTVNGKRNTFKKR